KKTLEELLQNITARTFFKQPINRYATTLSGMLVQVYENSPYDALKDLIDHDKELAEFKNFQPYDMQKAPQKMWEGKQGKTLARHATKTPLTTIQRTSKPLEELLPTITPRTFYKQPINKYATTLGGMLQHVYEGSPYDALKD